MLPDQPSWAVQLHFSSASIGLGTVGSHLENRLMTLRKAQRSETLQWTQWLDGFSGNI